ncbi:MAG TPA: isoprenylcysteine carboxylmethyltransferase family protein [Acidimicrobiales bacterium]|jgi:protein-S-isoprenylcysteine O-methyltransferase Ste14
MTNTKSDLRSPLAVATGARVFPVPPPAYYAAAFATGMFLQGAVPLDMPGRPASALLGAALLVAGLAMDVAGVAAVIAHHTTIVPHRPVTNLITSGIYRFSRNPMYTGLAIMVAGGALLAGTWCPLVFLPLALLAVEQLVIKPEETYLAERYGSVYTDYRLRVRRWL